MGRLNKATYNLTYCNMEIIKIDTELAECPKTGIRYFGYAKIKTPTDYYWECLGAGYESDLLPWFISEEALVQNVFNRYAHDKNNRPVQVIILKAEVPIRKLVIDDA